MKKMITLFIALVLIAMLCSCGSMTAEEHAMAYAVNTDWESVCGVDVSNPQEPEVNHSDPKHTYAMVDFDGGYIQFTLDGAKASATECTVYTYEPKPEGKSYVVDVKELED